MAPVIAPEGNSKFEILLVKIFKLKPKIYQILSATTQKIKSFSKQSLFFLDKTLQWGNVKQKLFRQI